MTTTLTSLLVGAHFRPPASTVLSHLPAGTSLSLDPDPENPYDSAAVRVLVCPKEISEDQFPALEEELPSAGWTLGDLLLEPSVWLGFIAATGGKPLAKSQMPGICGNKEFLAALSAGPEWRAELAFSPVNGDPLVRLTVLQTDSAVERTSERTPSESPSTLTEQLRASLAELEEGENR